MGEVIGPRGKVIHRIIDECGGDKKELGGISIDTMDDGKIFVVGMDMDNIQKAVTMINLILEAPELGKIYPAKVVRIMSFGAFVEIAPEKEGMVHISQLAAERVATVEDVVKVGDSLDVRLIEIDDQGRLNFSHRATLPGLEDSKPPPKKPRTDGPPRGRNGGGFNRDRGDRGPRDGGSRDGGSRDGGNRPSGPRN
jgi:polyribonucleotide nucleotidyltransferase